jgi:hypothetical protein
MMQARKAGVEVVEIVLPGPLSVLPGTINHPPRVGYYRQGEK